VLNIELQLRSLLIKEALSSMLTGAGFAVLHGSDQSDAHTIVIFDFEDSGNQENVHVYQSHGVKIVGLARDARSLEIDPDLVDWLSGILTYELSADIFVQSLRLIGTGERVFPRNLILERRPQAPEIPPRSSDGDRLSPREKEILSHIVEGRSNKVIARLLSIAEATVKVHLKNVLRKIRVENRTQAAIWALANLPEPATSPRGFV
jgi:two-component system nitrate/nitrite response regulator NarL